MSHNIWIIIQVTWWLQNIYTNNPEQHQRHAFLASILAAFRVSNMPPFPVTTKHTFSFLVYRLLSWCLSYFHCFAFFKLGRRKPWTWHTIWTDVNILTPMEVVKIFSSQGVAQSEINKTKYCVFFSLRKQERWLRRKQLYHQYIHKMIKTSYSFILPSKPNRKGQMTKPFRLFETYMSRQRGEVSLD